MTIYTIHTDASRTQIQAEDLDGAARSFAAAESISGIDSMGELVEYVECVEGAWLRVWSGDCPCAEIVAGDFEG